MLSPTGDLGHVDRLVVLFGGVSCSLLSFCLFLSFLVSLWAFRGDTTLCNYVLLHILLVLLQLHVDRLAVLFGGVSCLLLSFL